MFASVIHCEKTLIIKLTKSLKLGQLSRPEMLWVLSQRNERKRASAKHKIYYNICQFVYINTYFKSASNFIIGLTRSYKNSAISSTLNNSAKFLIVTDSGEMSFD